MCIYHTFKCFLYLNFLLVMCLLFTISSVSGLKCYSCNREDECRNFNLSNKHLYTKECPSHFRSCLAATKGNVIISMTCEEEFINDCKPLDYTKYCYCTSNLCNGKDLIVDDARLTNDDEDLNEGSGFSTFVNTGSTTTSSNKPYQPTIQPLNTGNCLHSAFIIVTAAALLW